MYKHCVKRIIDLILSLLATVLLFIVFVVIAVLIKLDSKGPVFFTQKRVGKDKKHFTILKFRTMYASTPKDVPTHLLKDPKGQITKIGAFLRKTSLDELPQLFNIICGNMSIVGPRPALWNQYDLIKKRDEYNVNALVPGLTGYAQINGRDELPIDVKAKYDEYYAINISFVLDVKIVFKTITNVLLSKGVKEGGTNGL